MLDGKPIVAIATAASGNRKTGDMIQTWILRRNVDPARAVKLGLDRSICGDCYHRGSRTRPRTCYVNLGQAPLAVYRGYKRGIYEHGELGSLISSLDGKPVRLGAYGDPVAVPVDVWSGVRLAKHWTGYTHQWRRPIAAPFKDLLMASCDGALDMVEARQAGWRTFTVTHDLGLERSIPCPSDRGVQCNACGLCSGLAKPNAPSILIQPHGTAKRFVEV